MKDFDVEQTSKCLRDFLEVYHTAKTSENLMEHLCGENEIPKDIHAPPGTMVILYFESDDTYSKRGFTLDWSKNCGGNIVVESQGQGLVTNTVVRNIQIYSQLLKLCYIICVPLSPVVYCSVVLLGKTGFPEALFKVNISDKYVFAFPHRMDFAFVFRTDHYNIRTFC